MKNSSIGAAGRAPITCPNCGRVLFRVGPLRRLHRATYTRSLVHQGRRLLALVTHGAQG